MYGQLVVVHRDWIDLCDSIIILENEIKSALFNTKANIVKRIINFYSFLSTNSFSLIEMQETFIFIGIEIVFSFTKLECS